MSKPTSICLALTWAAAAISATAQPMPPEEKQFIDEAMAKHDRLELQMSHDAAFARDLRDAVTIMERTDQLVEAGELQQALGEEHDIIAAVGPMTSRDARAAELAFVTDTLVKFGKDDALYDGWLVNLAAAYLKRGEPEDIPRVMRYATIAAQALKQSTRGRPCRVYGNALHYLGESQALLGKPELAVATLKQAIAAARGHDSNQAMYKKDLGEVLRQLGGRNTEAHANLDVAEQWVHAERERHDTVDLKSGEADVLYCQGLLAMDEGDFVEARGVLQKSRTLYGEVAAEVKGTPKEKKVMASQARVLRQLGFIEMVAPPAATRDQQLQDFFAAVKCLQQSVELFEAGKGHDDLEAVSARLTLGLSYGLHGDYAEAMKMSEPATEAELSAPPQMRLDLLRLRSALAVNAGRYDLARQYADQSLQVVNDFYGPSSLLAISARLSLAVIADDTGHAREAEAQFKPTLGAARMALTLAFAAESERRQMASEQAFRTILDAYVSFRSHQGWKGDGGYDEVLLWKGMVFARQAAIRRARESGDPAIHKLFVEIEQTSQELSESVFDQARDRANGPDDAEWKKRHDDRWKRIEALNAKAEGDLKSLSAPETGGEPAASVNAEAIERLLPPEAALVDFLEYSYRTKPRPGEPPGFVPSYVAYVVRHDRVVPIDLGPSAEIAEAVTAWTKDRCRDAKAGLAVRRLVWEKLAPALAGAKLILVSPDSALGNVPFGALPDDDGAYLIERFAFASIPVPQLLPAMMKTPLDKGGTALIVSPEVAVPGRPMPETESSIWSKLPRLTYAAMEVQDVRQLLTAGGLGLQPSVLLGPDATKEELRKAIASATYLHCAGHAFFEPALRQAIEAQHRTALGTSVSGGMNDNALAAIDSSLMCGLVMAPDPLHADDGALTAYEIGQMDLRHLNLAVLSGCDTAAGESAGGEGLLSLQRSCQVAGARTVIASLWPVQDEATQRLMKYFYADLMSSEHNRSLPLMSLRRAQFKVMREVSRERHTVAIIGEIGTVHRQPPAIWAPWVLSGSPGNLEEIIREMSSEKDSR